MAPDFARELDDTRRELDLLLRRCWNLSGARF